MPPSIIRRLFPSTDIQSEAVSHGQGREGVGADDPQLEQDDSNERPVVHIPTPADRSHGNGVDVIRRVSPIILTPTSHPKQNWVTFAADVDPSGKHPITVYTAQPPWVACLDFSAADNSDRFGLRTEYEYLMADGNWRWITQEQLLLRVATPIAGAGRHVMFDPMDGTPERIIGPSTFINLEPIPGPWQARLTFTQLSGITRPVRLLLF